LNSIDKEILGKGPKEIPREKKCQVIEECNYPTEEDIARREREILAELSREFEIPEAEVKKHVIFLILTDLTKGSWVDHSGPVPAPTPQGGPQEEASLSEKDRIDG
jgi:hypothetical protein